MTAPLHAQISDYTECPLCTVENVALGGGACHADCYFNAEGALWGVCMVHRVRWFVTRELLTSAALSAPEAAQHYRVAETPCRPWRLA